jgi:DNA invertase Pin-like site-specific DNA recombinase
VRAERSLTTPSTIKGPSPRRSRGFGTVRTVATKHSTLLGYARVSTADQRLDLQLDALAAAGCKKVWTDKLSGARADRPELGRLLDYAREGDTVVVWRLDRLGRSVRHLIGLVGDLDAAGIGLRSLQEGIDTTTPTGRLVFHVFSALAEFERDLIRERSAAGVAAARARGRQGGRPPVMTPAKVAAARQLLDAGSTYAHVATALGVGRTTIIRHLGPTVSS